MILGPSEVASVAGRLSFWECTEYFSEAAVALGCIGEYIAEYAEWARKRWTGKELHTLGRRSLFVLIFGIGFSLVSLIETNFLSGQVILSLGEEVSTIGQKAQLASSASEAAADSAVTAEDKAADAQAASSKAKDAAEKAQSEADSFEHDIVAAKEQSAEAESHLADALGRAASADQRALQAQQSLDAYKTPRSLNEAQQARIAAKLAPLAPQSAWISLIPISFEGGKLAEQVLATLKVHWHSDWFPGDPEVMTGVSAVSGIVVFPTRDPRSIKAADAVVEALRSEGVSANRSDVSIPGRFLPGCNAIPNASPTDPYCFSIEVVIGTKP